ncbi:Micrococcal nuclease-like nuclease [Neorhizobium galegae bv. officinalis]|uniref:Micrococcal nuclease-like nuclease n=1 Tax=Neorhizobium galegae bv. officinalis TaxID=323656 RepID=A0A0T7FZB0_NEOGA|nr:nuclease [Neorhizobium galegae]CDZ40278.1 Micrococcal nuclease-like nuclease [Neorhizobium galegae bv. officinalis]
MNNGAWRFGRLLFCTLFNALIALPFAARADTASEFASYYQNAYAEGRDLIPEPQMPLDTSSIASRLDLQTVSPKAALSGSAFLGADDAVIKLAGVQGCLSTEPIEFAGVQTTCAMISLAGLTAMLDEATTGAGDAFPCHVFAQNPGRPAVRFAECFFIEKGAVRSLSEALIRKGFVFAARDRAGRPVFPEYLQAEEAARGKQAGIWANGQFTHPYGERFPVNSSTN